MGWRGDGGEGGHPRRGDCGEQPPEQLFASAPGHRSLQELPPHPAAPGGATRRLLVTIPVTLGTASSDGGWHLHHRARLEGPGAPGREGANRAQRSR